MQCEINLRNIKQRNIIREPAFFSESRENFSSTNELEEHVDISFILKWSFPVLKEFAKENRHKSKLQVWRRKKDKKLVNFVNYSEISTSQLEMGVKSAIEFSFRI